MTLPEGPKLEIVEATETTIVVEFVPVSGANHQLEYKEYQAPWGQGSKTKQVASFFGEEGKSGKCKATLDGLLPGATYCLRMILEDRSGNQGPPGPELILDTEQVGCTPKQKNGCACAIL